MQGPLVEVLRAATPLPSLINRCKCVAFGGLCEMMVAPTVANAMRFWPSDSGSPGGQLDASESNIRKATRLLMTWVHASERAARSCAFPTNESNISNLAQTTNLGVRSSNLFGRATVRFFTKLSPIGSRVPHQGADMARETCCRSPAAVNAHPLNDSLGASGRALCANLDAVLLWANAAHMRALAWMT